MNNEQVRDAFKELLHACEMMSHANRVDKTVLDKAHRAYEIMIMDGVDPSLKPNEVSREVRNAMNTTEVFMKRSSEFTKEHFPNGRKLEHIVSIANVMARVHEAEMVSYYGKWRKENE
ncbi:MAG: hypothetical protein KAQ85_02270 [Thermodesulfovibrionia bacterium]|nr:hypothetical protein [Thermodesulfovibrionia bacterium]